MTRFIPILICLLVTPGSAFAQERVTDTELRAAYCLGVVRAQAEWIRGDPVKTALAGKQIVERESRLFDYLSAKGFLNGRETAGISMGIIRGKNDLAQCQSDPMKLACQAACPKIGDGLDIVSATKSLECTGRCVDKSAVCKRTKGCLQDFLPF